MKPIAEIVHDAGINFAGRTTSRQAVRGIILRGSQLLMIHAKTIGDYKFPGGGVRDDEDHQSALCREIMEETGARGVTVRRLYAQVIEYASAIEPEYDVFQMTSFYYLCQVEDLNGRQKLDPYEIDLGYEPAWVEIEQAISDNARIVRTGADREARWVKREVAVLERLRVDIDKLDL